MAFWRKLLGIPDGFRHDCKVRPFDGYTCLTLLESTTDSPWCMFGMRTGETVEFHPMSDYRGGDEYTTLTLSTGLSKAISNSELKFENLVSLRFGDLVEDGELYREYVEVSCSYMAGNFSVPHYGTRSRTFQYFLKDDDTLVVKDHRLRATFRFS